MTYVKIAVKNIQIRILTNKIEMAKKRRNKGGVKKPPPVNKKRITPQSAKAKGRNLQQWVAAQISNVVKLPHGKDQDIESRPMGQSGTDVRLSSLALQRFPYSVECKWQESWSVPAFIRQAKDNLIVDTDWLLFMKRSREEVVVCMEAMAFFRLFQKVNPTLSQRDYVNDFENVFKMWSEFEKQAKFSNKEVEKLKNKRIPRRVKRKK
jgi:hypothetical protein